MLPSARLIDKIDRSAQIQLARMSLAAQYLIARFDNFRTFLWRTKMTASGILLLVLNAVYPHSSVGDPFFNGAPPSEAGRPAFSSWGGGRPMEAASWTPHGIAEQCAGPTSQAASERRRLMTLPNGTLKAVSCRIIVAFALCLLFFWLLEALL
jgi:hypothetical protein